MPEYKVLKPGFWGGIFRVPDGRHDPVVTAAPIKNLPSWLEEIKSDEDPKVRRGKVTKPNETPADFLGEQQEDDKGGLETL